MWLSEVLATVWVVAGERWDSERVLALAPDVGSATAGRKLATGAGWSETGCDDTAVWGAAKGSGKNPYLIAVDLTGPAYKCSCPSRKIPCKHVLGLLLRWSGGDLQAAGEQPGYVAEWLTGRAARADQALERAAKKAAEPSKAPDPQAQAKRAEQRADRVAGGILELDRWLSDQVRAGLVSLQGSGYRAIDNLAARMVDAQAPGVASRVRGLAPLLTGGPHWTDRLLEELALLRLLARAHDRLGDLDASDPALAATVRGHVGYPVAKETVLESPPITDRWSVWCVRDTEAENNLRQRTAYLTGASGRAAVVLSFAVGGQPLDDSLPAGASIEASLHFYPGTWQRRALVGERADRPAEPVSVPRGATVAEALALVASAVAADPWVRSAPLWVQGQVEQVGEVWVVVDELGEAVPLRAGNDPWAAVAVCGGSAVPLLIDWSPQGWTLLAAWSSDAQLVSL